MERSNIFLIIGLLLFTLAPFVQSKCTLIPIPGETMIAYACVHSDLTDLEDVPTEVEWIEFTVSRIHYLPPDAFSRFTNLRRLTFYNCDLRQLSPDAFRGLDNLEWLVMSSTKIGLARAALFRRLKNLKRLTLDDAGLVYVEPEAFWGFRKLETLSLRDNDLDCLDTDALVTLTHLKTVQIGKNPWLCDCRNRLGKFFEERMIAHGPDEECVAQNFTNSRRFGRNVYDCMEIVEYPALPAPQATFKEIEEVYRGQYEWRETIATNIGSLERLPDDIGWIQLIDVRIPIVPRYAFFRFGNTLRSIELRNCGIEKIEREAFAGLHKLERLILIGNPLTVIGHDSFRDLVRISDLVIQNNRIERFEENALVHLGRLTRLNVKGNRLRCLPQEILRGLVSLQKLEADGNPWICDCKINLENYLRRMRIEYEISAGRCEIEPTPRRWQEENEIPWNSTTIGKVRWSWAWMRNRPTRPTQPPIKWTTPRTELERPFPSRSSGGCHLVRPNLREPVETCICTTASLDDLSVIPDTVQNIVFSGSTISTIRNDAFLKFARYLKRLEFRDCVVQNIERRAFYGLRNLETLVIRGNDFNTVESEWFEELSNLKYLDLSRNGIMRIPNGVFDKLPYLVSLDISDNQMNCIGIEYLETLRYLRELKVTGNPWTCLCARSLVQFLETRRISCNCNPKTLVEITDGGWGCHPTTGLSRPPTPAPPTRPPLVTYPPPIFTAPPLPPSQVGSCYPSHETDKTGPWYHCSNGDISVLRKIPSYVRKIEIVDSSIAHLPPMAFSRFENLTELVLRNCTLRDVDRHAFVGLGNLVKLTLRKNRFTIVKNSWFSDTRNLVRLDLSDNYLTEIETGAFDDLTRLEYINLEGNAFQCIYTNCFVGLPSLATVEFGRNPLKWRCWQDLRQFLEIRAIGYTYYKCPHDGKEIIASLLKNDKPPPQEFTSATESLKFNEAIIFGMLVFSMRPIFRSFFLF